MKDVEFDCVVESDQACVFVYVGNIGKCAYFPCEIEYLDAKEEVLSSLHDEVLDMLRSIEHAERALSLERAKRGQP